MRPERVLAAATSGAAELCGVAGRRGRLAPGLDADLLVVRGDVLDLPTLRRRIREVWQLGRRVVDNRDAVEDDA